MVSHLGRDYRHTLCIDSFASAHTDYPSFENLLHAYGIIAFQFDIHPMLLTIEVDMEQKRKIGRAVTYGILGKLLPYASSFK